MTNLEGLDLPDRQFAVFCKSHFSPSSEGCFPPPSAPSSCLTSSQSGSSISSWWRWSSTNTGGTTSRSSTSDSSSFSTTRSSTSSTTRSMSIGILNDLLWNSTICNVRSHISGKNRRVPAAKAPLPMGTHWDILFRLHRQQVVGLNSVGSDPQKWAKLGAKMFKHTSNILFTQSKFVPC